MDPIEELVLKFLDDFSNTVIRMSDWAARDKKWQPTSGPYEGRASVSFSLGNGAVRPNITHSFAQSVIPLLSKDPAYQRITIMWVSVKDRSTVEFRMTVAPEGDKALIDTLTPEQLEELRKKG